MAGKAKARGKKKSARVAKPAPVTRKRRVGPQTTIVDPVLALREHREKLEALLEEARKLQEATLQGIGQLVETTVSQTRRIAEQITDELERLDDHARKLKKKHDESNSEEDDRYTQGLNSESGLIQDAA
jgi:excinuclease UvrABC helicase subunit UvrB